MRAECVEYGIILEILYFRDGSLSLCLHLPLSYANIPHKLHTPKWLVFSIAILDESIRPAVNVLLIQKTFNNQVSIILIKLSLFES
jgi:hypothetical protein